MFTLFYQNQSRMEDILGPCQWLKSSSSMVSHTDDPAPSRKRASSSTDTGRPKRTRTKAARTAQSTPSATIQPALVFLVDDDDSTATSTDTDSHASQSPVSITQSTSRPVQERKSKNNKAKKDRRDNTPPHHMLSQDATDPSDYDTPIESPSDTVRARQAAAGPVRNGPHHDHGRPAFSNQELAPSPIGRRDLIDPDQTIDNYRTPTPQRVDSTQPSGRRATPFRQRPPVQGWSSTNKNTRNRQWHRGSDNGMSRTHRRGQQRQRGGEGGAQRA